MPRHSVAQCDVQQSCTSRRPCALALDLRAPLRGGEGWTKRPAGGIGTDADSFSPGQEPPRKARPPLTDWPASPASAKRGCSFFWHCHHLGGYFSLGKQRKVTRPPAGGRKPAVPQGLPSGRNEPGRGNATTQGQEQSHWTPALAPSCGVRRGDGFFVVTRQEWPLTTMKVAMSQPPPQGGAGTSTPPHRTKSRQRMNQAKQQAYAAPH